MVELRCGNVRAIVNVEKFCGLCSIWQTSRKILVEGYDVKTEVTSNGWEVFVNFLNGEDVCLDISEGIYPSLVKLSKEFGCKKLEEVLRHWRTKVKEGLVHHRDLLDISSELTASRDVVEALERRVARNEEKSAREVEECRSRICEMRTELCRDVEERESERKRREELDKNLEELRGAVAEVNTQSKRKEEECQSLAQGLKERMKEVVTELQQMRCAIDDLRTELGRVAEERDCERKKREALEKDFEELKKKDGQTNGAEDVKILENRVNDVERRVHEKDFDFDDGVIKEYKGGDREIRIPEEIHGKAVRRLETNWDDEDDDFRGGRNSWSCAVSIHLPSSLESIGRECFCGCSSLTSVEFASDIHLKSIGYNAFCESGLRNIHLPSSLESIGYRCFYECKSLRSVEFASDIHLKSIGECAFQESGLTSIHLPSSLESIGNACFFGCSSLRSVEFASDIHLKSIGYNAFAGSGLRSIHLPSSLESIGGGCFKECRSLRSVEFASDIHLKNIGNSAFEGSGLKSVKIPRSFGFRNSFPDDVRFEVRSSKLKNIHHTTSNTS